MKITKKIKSFKDAAILLGLDPNALPQVSGLPEKHAKAIISNYKLWIISEACWEGVKIDWSNYEQYKYYPWFIMSDDSVPSSFSFVVFVYDFSFARVGARLCYPTSEIATYIGKTFIDLYQDVMVIIGN